MAMVIDLNLACLICLQDTEVLHSIYDHDEQTPELQIAEKIALCRAELQMPQMEDSRLPDKICQQCLSDLDGTWRFQQNCKAANAVFNTMLQQDENAETMDLDDLNEKVKMSADWTPSAVAASEKYILPNNIEQNEDTISGDETHEVEALNDDDDLVEEEQEQHSDSLEQYDETEDVVEQDYYESHEDQTLDDEVTEEGEVKFASSEEDDTGETLTEQKPLAQTQRRGRNKYRVKYEPFMDAAEEHATVPDIKQEEDDEEQENERLSQGANKTAVDGNERKWSASQSSGTSTTSRGGGKIVGDGSKRVLSMRMRKSLSPKICEICGNTYKYQHALNAHMRRHTNTRPFKCEFCDKGFVAHVELRRHIRVHTGQKPYACQYCDRRFSDFGSRGKHERSHTGERPYVCACGKSFAYPHVLSVHRLTHTGEKKFQCTECSKGFTKKAYLLAHMEQHSRIAGAVKGATSSITNAAGVRKRQSRHDSNSSAELKDMKTVAMEECIFTTEYIVDGDEADDDSHVDDVDCKG